MSNICISMFKTAIERCFFLGETTACEGDKDPWKEMYYWPLKITLTFN